MIDPIDRFASLTPAQRRVMDLLILGHNTQAIAKAMEVSVKTIDTHRLYGLRKLGCKSVVLALRLSLSCGYTTLDVQP